MNEKIICMSFFGLCCVLHLDLHTFMLDLLINMILGIEKWCFLNLLLKKKKIVGVFMLLNSKY